MKQALENKCLICGTITKDICVVCARCETCHNDLSGVLSVETLIKQYLEALEERHFSLDPRNLDVLIEVLHKSIRHRLDHIVK